MNEDEAVEWASTYGFYVPPDGVKIRFMGEVVGTVTSWDPPPDPEGFVCVESCCRGVVFTDMEIDDEAIAERLSAIFGRDMSGVSITPALDTDAMLATIRERIRGEIPDPRDPEVLRDAIASFLGPRRPIVTSFDEPYWSDRDPR